MIHFILLTIVVFMTSWTHCAHTLSMYPTDTPIQYKFDIPANTYHQYCKDYYSQNGEDGIIEQLIKELDIRNGTFCEFGASNGITSSNTYNLIKNHHFSGIAIEAHEGRYRECVKNYKAFPAVHVFHGAVLYHDPHNDLNAWLTKGNLPHDLDVLSIDIDSDDYHVWKNLTLFSPKIVIIEINPYRDPVFEELHNNPSREYNIDLLTQWYPARVASGCSFISAVKLGLQKEYIPVSFTGNVTFVRKDLAHRLKQFPYHISDNPYDYLHLYTHLSWLQGRWHTNTGLILNTAIRDYYLTFKKKLIDISWLNNHMHEIMHNEHVTF